MSEDDSTAFFQFTRFLKQKGEDEFDEIDRSRLFEELFQNVELNEKFSISTS